eukprot:gene5781-9602_t
MENHPVRRQRSNTNLKKNLSPRGDENNVQQSSKKPQNFFKPKKESINSPEIQSKSLPLKPQTTKFNAPDLVIQEQKMLIQKFQSKIQKYQTEMNDVAKKLESTIKELDTSLNISNDLKNLIQEDEEIHNQQIKNSLETISIYKKNQEIFDTLTSKYESIIENLLSTENEESKNSSLSEYNLIKETKKNLQKIEVSKDDEMNKKYQKIRNDNLQEIEIKIISIKKNKKKRKPTVYLINKSKDIEIEKKEQEDDEYEKSPFEIMLEDNDLFESYLKFLTSQACEENLLFYGVATEFRLKFKSMRKDERNLIAKTIFDTYIRENSMYELNLDISMRNKIEEQLKNEDIERDIFKPVITFTSYMMMTDTFSRFRMKSENQELMAKFKHLEL